MQPPPLDAVTLNGTTLLGGSARLSLGKVVLVGHFAWFFVFCRIKRRDDVKYARATGSSEGGSRENE